MSSATLVSEAPVNDTVASFVTTLSRFGVRGDAWSVMLSPCNTVALDATLSLYRGVEAMGQPKDEPDSHGWLVAWGFCG